MTLEVKKLVNTVRKKERGHHHTVDHDEIIKFVLKKVNIKQSPLRMDVLSPQILYSTLLFVLLGRFVCM